jgi:putative DNA primase/helicase
MGQAAIAFARRGWAVFPCNVQNGRPLVVGDRDDDGEIIKNTGGLHKATCDAAQIEAWWRKWPNAQIGLNSGASGLLHIDFDPRVDELVDEETGEVTREEWSVERLKAALTVQMGEALPATLVSTTPSGGEHHWFRMAAGEPIGNRGNLPLHVDVRGHGGYVIAPPSERVGDLKTGGKKAPGAYRWAAGDWADADAIAPLPASLERVLRERAVKAGGARAKSPARPRSGAAPIAAVDVSEDVRKYAMVAVEAECRDIRNAASGNRNAQLNSSVFKVATLVAAGAIDEGFARACVEAAARANPGNDDDRQLSATIESGWTAGFQQPRDLAEVVASSRSRQERKGQRQSAPSRPAASAPPPVAAGREENAPFRVGSVDCQQALGAADRARLRAVSAAWLERRIQHIERTKDAATRLAFSVGRRVGAGLLDEVEAAEALWAGCETIADVQPDDIDRALGDGVARGFDATPILLTIKCAGFPLTDFGIAERFFARYGADYRFTTAKGWLGWDGRRWKVLDQEKDIAPAEVVAAVFETVRAIQTEGQVVADTGVQYQLTGSEKQRTLELESDNLHGLDHWRAKGKEWHLHSSMIRVFGRQSEVAGKPQAIANLSRRWLTVPIEAFDVDPYAINVMNGTLRFARERLPDGTRSAGVELCPHRRDDLNTKLAPVEYDPDAASPVYDAFLIWAQPDEEMRRYLHQCAGYGASGDTSEQKLWFWYGLGANGKSTTIDLWAHVLGDYAGTIGIETFLDQGIKKRGEQASPDLARLGGVRLLRASEPERGAKLNEALIKAATGGEPMAVRALHRGFFDLTPLFKLFIGGNYRPDVPGTDEGIWRRLKLVMWDAHVEDKDRDEQLPAKLRAEAPGVLNHIVRGMLDWLTRGLVEPQAVATATQQYREDSDPLSRFLNLCTERVVGSRVQSSVLYDVFVAWSKAAGETEWKQKGFSKAMTDKGWKKKASDGIQWLDLKLVKTPSDFVDEHGRVIDHGDGDQQRRADDDDDIEP